MSATFLTDEELISLTGKCWKSKQIETLRKMGLQFWVNGCGKPVVPKSAIEGKKIAPQPKIWNPPE